MKRTYNVNISIGLEHHASFDTLPTFFSSIPISILLPNSSYSWISLFLDIPTDPWSTFFLRSSRDYINTALASDGYIFPPFHASVRGIH